MVTIIHGPNINEYITMSDVKGKNSKYYNQLINKDCREMKKYNSKQKNIRINQGIPHN